MSAAVCPKCGVAVVPGYVKCPKCHTVLPVARAAKVAAGGTAMGGQGTPVAAFVVGGAVALGIVLFFALRKSSSEAAAPPDGGDGVEQSDPAGSAATDPTATPDDPATTPGSPAGPGSVEAITALDRSLKKERLWGKVEVVGTRVEIRTTYCADPAMTTVLDAAGAALKEAGLTRLRCMEQSGAVVFERDL
ncbi:MAG: hypothetical protein IPQ07_00835 [Myxococcales bacterium]|nr:hypothetical protein [Myxococcales bacterium]